jgi:hypothetical protein
MRITISEDVSYIYKKCGLSIEETSRPRTAINTGNLYNCLNTTFNSAGHAFTFPCLVNNSSVLDDLREKKKT